MKTASKTDMLSFEQAREKLLARARVLARPETRPLAESLGRVLARGLVSPCVMPPTAVSALDGYAIRRADLSAAGPSRLPISQRVTAGKHAEPLAAGTAARIFTGAMMPSGADAIIAQEATCRDGDTVVFSARPSPYEDVKPPGSDVQAGEQILQAGRRLRPQDLALAASVGMASLPVHTPLRIALLCTGDELIQPGQALPTGCIYDANRFLIPAQLQALGMAVTGIDAIRDSARSTRDALARAMREADVIITTGGVSVGEEDHVRAAIQTLGKLHMWRVNMKPGKPFTYGELGERRVPILGLPGNPVSAFLNFALFARPFLLRCQGAVDDCNMSLRLPAGFDWPEPRSRREFLRARIDPCDPQRRVTLYPNQGSSALISTAWANGIAVIRESETLRAGDPVEFIPLSSMNLF